MSIDDEKSRRGEWHSPGSPENPPSSLEISIVSPEDTIVLPQRAIVLPEDAIVLPQDTIVLPQDIIVRPEDAIVLPQDVIIFIKIRSFLNSLASRVNAIDPYGIFRHCNPPRAIGQSWITFGAENTQLIFKLV